MNSVREVQIEDANGHVQMAELSIVDEEAECSLELKAEQLPTLRVEGPHLFKCLQLLRNELEQFECRILCNGARRDVYATGFCISMGTGRVAYLLKEGQVLRREDLVDIFGPTDSSLVDTVDAQKEYFRKWLEEN